MSPFVFVTLFGASVGQLIATEIRTLISILDSEISK